MAREFSIVRELSQREIDRHKKRFIGITSSAPAFSDTNGLLEWTCNVRVESHGQYVDDDPPIPPGDWGIIKGVLLAQWVIGLVADVNVPVLLERSESGRLTIIARSEVRLPDINYDSYTWDELNFIFMANLEDRGTDGWFDGFGYEMTSPEGQTGSHASGEWVVELVPLEDTTENPFDIAEFIWNQWRARWKVTT